MEQKKQGRESASSPSARALPAETRALRRTPSVRDVARVAGVSEQTVSRAMHDSPAVRPQTRERVLAAAAELGYRPSGAARALRRGRCLSIGVAMQRITTAGNLDRLDGFATAAEEHGYSITLLKTDPAQVLTLAEAARRMSLLSVDGMIYAMNRMPSDYATFEPLPNLPAVIASTEPHPVCSTVDCDHVTSSGDVVAHLLAHGHKTVHHIGGRVGSLAAIHLEEGWRRALALRGVEPPEVVRGDWSADSGYEAGLRLAADPSCTAVFAANDAMAYGCICALRDRGLSVPDDVSVVGVDNDLERLVPHAGLTSVQFDNKRIGRWAIEKLLGESDDPGREHVLFPGRIVERTSVGPYRPR